MNENVFNNQYFGKERFQSKAEAQRRRVEQGKLGQRLTRWTVEQAKSLVSTGPVLDLACGNGRNLQALATGGMKVLGGDISEPMLKSAQELVTPAGHFPLLRFEAENLPFTDGAFDVTFSVRFFHHLPTRRVRERVLSEAFRVSRNGIVITYKARFTYEHLVSSLRKLLHGVKKTEGRQFIGRSEIEDIARSQGWRVSRDHSVRGCLSANRALVLEPDSEQTC